MRGVTVPVLAAWESSTRTTLVAGRKQAKDVAVTAATELYFDIRALPVEQGRPFTGQEVQAGVPVLVLGHELADKLFEGDRKSTRLNSSHTVISYAVFCLKKKTKKKRR